EGGEPPDMLEHLLEDRAHDPAFLDAQAAARQGMQITAQKEETLPSAQNSGGGGPQRRLHRGAVDEGAVVAAEILDFEVQSIVRDAGVAAGTPAVHRQTASPIPAADLQLPSL